MLFSRWMLANSRVPFLISSSSPLTLCSPPLVFSICISILKWLFAGLSHCLCALLFTPPISQKQMRTLRCGLRYTGVAWWTRSVHRTFLRCTKKSCPVPSFWLSCCCCCLPSHYHTTQQTDFISDCCCRAAAASIKSAIHPQSAFLN